MYLLKSACVQLGIYWRFKLWSFKLCALCSSSWNRLLCVSFWGRYLCCIVVGFSLPTAIGTTIHIYVMGIDFAPKIMVIKVLCLNKLCTCVHTLSGTILLWNDYFSSFFLICCCVLRFAYWHCMSVLCVIRFFPAASFYATVRCFFMSLYIIS